MDVFASKLLHALSVGFAAMLPIAFWGGIIMLIRVALGRTDKATAEKLGMTGFTFLVAYALLLGATALALHFSAKHAFNALMMKKPNRLLIIAEGKTNEITETSVITQFFALATHASKVPAHHSHPVSEITLVFPQTGYIYSLGPDSQVPHEFWFDWNGISGRKRGWLHVSAGLGQLRSEELDRWVQKYSPSPVHSGTNGPK